MSDWFIAWPDWKYRVEREGGLMSDFKCDSVDCGGWVCIYHGLRLEVQEHIDQLEARIEALEEDRDTIAEWLSKALDRNADKLEAEIVQLKKDAAPFQAQINQRKTYKGPDEQS